MYTTNIFFITPRAEGWAVELWENVLYDRILSKQLNDDRHETYIALVEDSTIKLSRVTLYIGRWYSLFEDFLTFVVCCGVRRIAACRNRR